MPILGNGEIIKPKGWGEIMGKVHLKIDVDFEDCDQATEDSINELMVNIKDEMVRAAKDVGEDVSVVERHENGERFDGEPAPAWAGNQPEGAS